MRATTAIPILSAMLIGGCTQADRNSHGQPLEVGTENVAFASAPVSTAPGATSPSVGGPCTASDGYQLRATGYVDAGSATPVAMVPNADFVDFHDLPYGVGYCIPSGHAFPHGYYTMNCGSTRDCPAGGACAFGRCVRPCASDNDCASATHCVPQGQVSVCKAGAPVSAGQSAVAGAPVAVQTGTSTLSLATP